MSSSSSSSSDPPTLFNIPFELRTLILTAVVPSDLALFATSFRRPALLRTNLQLRKEYTDILFCSNPKIAPVQLHVYAYYPETDAWALISDKHVARDIFESSSFDEELALCSGLAAAQRAVQRNRRRRSGAVVCGLLVVEGRIWQWTRLEE